MFVANRVQMIREITDTNQWNYVDTAQNPADHDSRGLHATDISSPRWLSPAGDIIPSLSPLLCLDPILDGGLLRVGGRLKRSTLSQASGLQASL